MNSPVELELFDFFDDFAEEVNQGTIDSGAVVAESSEIITFCENFFAQFFDNFLKTPISGFGKEAKRTAAKTALQMRRKAGTEKTRALVALFESFCDVHADVIAGSYGAEEITYVDFHERYMRRLLDRIAAWAKACKVPSLEERVKRAATTYDAALKAKHW